MKYAMEHSRVYVDVLDEDGRAIFTIKNVSESSLNISPEELTERFVRGDVSRATEGSGLGLSISKDLTQLQGGEFQVVIDGDLFKAVVSFPVKRAELKAEKTIGEPGLSLIHILTGSDFYQQQYGIMFDAMVELFNEGKPVDLVTLQDRLKAVSYTHLDVYKRQGRCGRTGND